MTSFLSLPFGRNGVLYESLLSRQNRFRTGCALTTIATECVGGWSFGGSIVAMVMANFGGKC